MSKFAVIALVGDLAGNEEINEIKIPHIRNFKNLDKILYEKGIVIVMHELNVNDGGSLCMQYHQ